MGLHRVAFFKMPYLLNILDFNLILHVVLLDQYPVKNINRHSLPLTKIILCFCIFLTVLIRMRH